MANQQELEEHDQFGDRLTVELPRAERSRIITHLMNVRDVALSDRPIIGATKRSLESENKRIINQLLDLPCKVQRDMVGGSSSTEEIIDENENTGEKPLKRQRGR